MFVIGISKDMSIIEVFMLSISLAVAAIPEGFSGRYLSRPA